MNQIEITDLVNTSQTYEEFKSKIEKLKIKEMYMECIEESIKLKKEIKDLEEKKYEISMKHNTIKRRIDSLENILTISEKELGDYYS
ncbi:MAG: hypothetical protein KDK54_19755 [Leptospiraceae bacterium]|nr:hypothetical protein [Leptospiraceae bacterium]